MKSGASWRTKSEQVSLLSLAEKEPQSSWKRAYSNQRLHQEVTLLVGTPPSIPSPRLKLPTPSTSSMSMRRPQTRFTHNSFSDDWQYRRQARPVSHSLRTDEYPDFP